MTQLDFFDMQEDQERAWEEQNKKHRAEEIAKKSNMSAAEVRAEGTQTDKPQTFSRATDVGTQFFDISDEHEKMTSDERARRDQQKENVRRKVEHNLGENPGTIPFIDSRASSSQGYSSMYVPGPKISIHHRTVGEQAYTSHTTQGPHMEHTVKSQQGSTSEISQGPHVEQNLKRDQYYTSETSQGPSFSVHQNLRREKGYTSSTTAKKPIKPRIRLKKRTGDDITMDDSSAGQQAPKRSASAHPEDPDSKKPAPNAPKMSQPSASSASASGPAASSSSGPDPATKPAPAAKKGEKKDDKKGVRKDDKKDSKPRPNPAHATEVDTSNDLKHWEKQNKTKLVDQITKRGFRGDMKKLGKMTKKQLAALIITLPVP
jgi:hypothetical protein